MSGIRAFYLKNAPTALGGIKFYDHLLKDLTNDNIYKAWHIFHQQFIDDVFNEDSKEKWTAVPFLNTVDSPCDPGCVIVSKKKSAWDTLSRHHPDAFLVGPYTDFLPSGHRSDTVPKPVDVVTDLTGRFFRKVYQAKNSEKAVVVTLVVQDERRFRKPPTVHDTFLALDNFDETWFKVSSCFMASHVITASTLRVEVTIDGSVFYEYSFSSATPICFRCYKLTMNNAMDGTINKIQEVKKKLPLTLKRRRIYQHFFNAFIPNQIRMSKAVGDSPPVINWRQSPARKSFRPRYLPRIERPSTNIVHYFKNDDELASLKLFWQVGVLDHHTVGLPRPQ